MKKIYCVVLTASITLLVNYLLPYGSTLEISFERPSPIPVTQPPPVMPKPNGDFVWARHMGGTSAGDAGQGYDIATDIDGNVYVTGGFTGTLDFDPGVNTFDLTSSSADYSDAFVVKLDSTGNLIWAKSMGGVNNDFSYDIALDADGSVYTMGSFEGSADFDPGDDEFPLTSAGLRDAFVARFDSSGNLIWAKSVGGASDDGGSAVAVGENNNLYVTGFFQGSADFDTSGFNIKSAGKSDIFVASLDGDGNFLWVKDMGGMQDDFGYGIALNPKNDVYITGLFNGVADFNPSGESAFLAGSGKTNFFVTKLSSNGSFLWAKDMGGSSSAESFNIVADAQGNTYTIGRFWDTVDFDPGEGIADVTSLGNSDLFIAKLNADGNFVWVKNVGGAGSSDGLDIAIDSAGSLYATGSFSSTAKFDPGGHIFELTASGARRDIFVVRLDKDGNLIWAKAMGGDVDDLGVGIAVDAYGNVYTTGNFSGTADFDPGAGESALTSGGQYDVFVIRLNGTPVFSDVPPEHPQYQYIQALYVAGLTSGCEIRPLKFCPDQILDRAQSAVFMLRAQSEPDYVLPAAPWKTFTDDWTGYEWAEPWAEGMYREGLTKGCQSNPLMYCPSTQLPRLEVSVFALRLKYGVEYAPPPASGSLFADLPSTGPNQWGIAWAEQAYRDGIIPSCGTQMGKPMFCPDDLVSRAWAAYLIVKAKDLPLP